jgi:hypothetical protein
MSLFTTIALLHHAILRKMLSLEHIQSYWMEPELKKVEKEGYSIGAMIGPNSVVPPGRLIPAGQLWAGNPVEYVTQRP